MVSFVDVVKGQVVSLANQGFQKVAGNLRGVVGSALNREGVTANETITPKLDPKAFTFPLDVANPDQGLGNHGHYILFFINEQENAKISFGRKNGSSKGAVSMREAATESGTDDVGLVSEDMYKAATKDEMAFLRTGAGNLAMTVEKKIEQMTDSTIGVTRPPTVQLDTAIALYMPPTVSVTYTANYTDTEIGAGAAAGLDMIKAASQGLGAVVDVATSDKVTRDLVDGARKAGLGALGNVPGFQGSRELFEMQAGYIMTNRMEIAFKGIPKRGFQYTFKMIPKSEQEAEEVRNIVKAFKMNMLPEGSNTDVSFNLGFTGKNFKIPNTFDIKYMFVGRENQYLNKISTCVLESMNVSYGGDRYKTFDGNSDGAPPVETTMTLNFKEMELITKEKAATGF